MWMEQGPQPGHSVPRTRDSPRTRRKGRMGVTGKVGTDSFQGSLARKDQVGARQGLAEAREVGE